MAHRVPYPPDKGDRIRVFHLLKFLAARAKVSLACLADEPVHAKTLDALKLYCSDVAVIPHGGAVRWLRALASVARGRTVSEGVFQSPLLRKTLATWARNVDFHAIVVSASSLAPYVTLPELRHVPAVVDMVDVDSQKWFDYAASERAPRSWLFGMEGGRLRRLERDLPRHVRAVTLVSPAEAKLYQTFCAPGTVRYAVNGVDLEYFQPQVGATESGCAFVGALDYRPNVLGAAWFCDEVWPHVHAKHPTAKMALVGRRPAPAVEQLARLAGVELVGQVPDVRPYVANAAVCVVPLTIARGVQNKVLEAMAMGKAVVASPAALAGIDATPGVHLLCCRTASEWSDTVTQLMDDADSRIRLGKAARRFVEERHHWGRCLEPFGEILELPAPCEQPLRAKEVA